MADHEDDVRPPRRYALMMRSEQDYDREVPPELSKMISTIVILAVLSFGFSRLLLFVLRRTFLAEERIVAAHIGSTLILAIFLFGALFWESGDSPVRIAIAAAFAAIFQGFWYWRDSSLPLSPNADVRPQHDENWQIAIERYPDLADIEARLSAISDDLADQFRANLQKTKSFSNRQQIASQLEKDFYFGQNLGIVQFARRLIQFGHKKAANEIKKTIAVLWDSAYATLTSKVEQKLPDAHPNPLPKEPASETAKRLLRTQSTSDAILLLRAIGAEVHEAHSLETLKTVLVLNFQDHMREFKTDYELTQWVIAEIASVVARSES